MKTILLGSKHDVYPGLIEEVKELSKESGLILIAERWFSSRPHPRYYVPKELLDELLEEYPSCKAVLVPSELTVDQYNSLASLVEEKVEIIDRVNLLLQVFEKRANSWESKIETELAKLKYLRPRLQASLKYSLQKERAGFFSTGEMEKEELVRDVKKRVHSLERKLRRRHEIVKKQIQQRAELQEIPLIPILGFYSTGKTTLFNQLTENNQPTGEEPFVTMAAKIGRSTLFPLPLDFADTVGITLLPVEILESFRITFEPILYEGIAAITLDLSRKESRIIEEVALVKRNIQYITGQTVGVETQNRGRFTLIPVFTKADLCEDPKNKAHQILSTISDREFDNHEPVIFSRAFDANQFNRFIAYLFETLQPFLSSKIVETQLEGIAPQDLHAFYGAGHVEKIEYEKNGLVSISGVFYRNKLSRILAKRR